MYDNFIISSAEYSVCLFYYSRYVFINIYPLHKVTSTIVLTNIPRAKLRLLKVSSAVNSVNHINLVKQMFFLRHAKYVSTNSKVNRAIVDKLSQMTTALNCLSRLTVFEKKSCSQRCPATPVLGMC